jgi:hypothetical protein
MPINPRWLYFICGACGRTISDCKPANAAPSDIPTVEEIASCAVCAMNARNPHKN